jgi:hypothetical protein
VFLEQPAVFFISVVKIVRCQVHELQSKLVLGAEYRLCAMRYKPEGREFDADGVFMILY